LRLSARQILLLVSSWLLVVGWGVSARSAIQLQAMVATMLKVDLGIQYLAR